MERFGPRSIAPSGVGHIRERESLEMVSHVVAGLLPDRQEHALPFVTARTTLMRFTEVAKSDGAVDGRDDFGEPDVTRCSSQGVAPTDSTFRADQSGTLQRQEDLLEIGLR